MNKKYKLAVLVSHPIQYQVPLFRLLATHPNIDLTVYFCADWCTKDDFIDPGFSVVLKWDIPLLEGYTYKFLPNLCKKTSLSFWGLINPSIIKEILYNRYDAIWIHGYASLSDWLAFLGAWVSRTPILLRGESHLINYRPGLKMIFKSVVLLPLFKAISAFLPIGTLNTAYYKHYGVSGKKMFLTPYCVDNTLFSKWYQALHGKREQIKKKLGIQANLSVVLYASKMMPRKRAIDILKAYETIHDKVSAAVVFVGDGKERPALEVYAKQHNLKNVYFAGFKNQTELPEYFAVADVFVLPSTDEPWGLIINEVMNFGLPIITTDQVGAGPDLVKHGENGFIYPVGDVEKLSNCLLKLLNDSGLRNTMGNRSLTMINKWSYTEDVEGILSALKYVENKTHD